MGGQTVPHMAAIWLAGYGDGAARQRLESPSLRSKIAMPPAPLLRKLLVELGGPSWDISVLQSLQDLRRPPNVAPLDLYGMCKEEGGCRAPVIALLRVSADSCSSHRGRHGTAWHEQSLVQLDAYHRSLGKVFTNVMAVGNKFKVGSMLLNDLHDYCLEII